MLGQSYNDQNCSIARTLEVVGERWTLLIIRDALLGHRRFDEFQQSLGVARNVLTDRLGRLIEGGVLVRTPYQTNPVRYDYKLTEKGHELRGVIFAMMTWGDKYVASPEGPPRVIRHTDCGGSVTQQLSCERCGIVPAAEVATQPGPGWKRIGG